MARLGCQRRVITIAALAIACGLSACNAILGIGDPIVDQTVGDASTDVDAASTPEIDSAPSPDANPPTCRHGDPFTSPALVRGLENVPVCGGRLNGIETNIYLSALTDGGWDLFIAGRDSIDDKFGPLAKLSNSTQSDDYWPSVDAQEEMMFFESGTNPDAPGGPDRIWFSTRDNTTADFGRGGLSTFFSILPDSIDSAPYLLPSGSVLFFASVGRSDATVDPPLDRTPSQDIWELHTNRSGTMISNRRLTEISTDEDTEQFPVVTADEREIFFTRTVLGDTNDDIWFAQRDAGSVVFDSPSILDTDGGAVNSSEVQEWASWISPDNCRLYFVRSPRSGSLSETRLWVAERIAR